MTVDIPYQAATKPVYETLPYNGANFVTATWKVAPDVEYKGKIVYVHGFTEVSTLYTVFFDKLAREGYEVFFFSQRGAPETSPGKAQGDSNAFHARDDLEHFIKLNLDARKDKSEKLFLSGHSMGGGILLEYGINGKYLDNIRGFLICGPSVILHPKTAPSSLFYYPAKIISFLLPKVKVDSGIHIEYLTHDEKWGEYVAQTTPKMIGTLKFFSEFLGRGDELAKKTTPPKFTTKVPLLIVHGTADYLNHCEGSKKFVSLLNSNVEKELVLIEGGLHCLFLETPEYFDPTYKAYMKFLSTH